MPFVVTRPPATLPLIVVVGPTAVGKSALVYRLIDTLGAAHFEIINGDSIQHYRFIDIGSAKPPARLRQRYPHHLIDVLDPTERYSVVEFVRRVQEVSAAIVARGHIPILCGGSIYFIFHLLYGLPQTPPSDASLRHRIAARLRVEGGAALHRELQEIDPQRGRQISPHDSLRIVRNLEIYYTSGVPPSSFARTAEPARRFHSAIIALTADRAAHKERIIARTTRMWERGLPHEVEGLVMRGYTAEAPALRAIGYRQFFDQQGALMNALHNSDVGEQIRGEIIRATIRYAKHQRTFMKQIPVHRQYRREDSMAIVRHLRLFLESRPTQYALRMVQRGACMLSYRVDRR